MSSKEGRVWHVQSEGGDFPIRQQYLECLEKIEAHLLKARKAIPGDPGIDYDYALPTIIFAEVASDESGTFLKMTCYDNRREFKRALEDEETMKLPEIK